MIQHLGAGKILDMGRDMKYISTYNLSRRDDVTTETLDIAMAAAAIQGCSASPKRISAPERFKTTIRDISNDDRPTLQLTVHLKSDTDVNNFEDTKSFIFFFIFKRYKYLWDI